MIVHPSSHLNSAHVFQDGNGTIENEELRGFLKDLLELVKKVGRNGDSTLSSRGLHAELPLDYIKDDECFTKN